MSIEEETVEKLELTRKQAIDLLKEMGKEVKPGYSDEVLVEMLESIQDFQGTASTDELDSLISEMFNANEIVIKKEVKEETTIKENEMKTNKKKVGKKVEKTEAAPKSEEKVDKFNTRLGTMNAKINTFLSKTPVTAEKIAEKTKFTPNRIKAEMYVLTKRGLVEKTKDGYISKI